MSRHLPVVLFGYESSTFTAKVRFALRIKQIPYTFIAVPSMMPRAILRKNFHLTYRKIPICAIGRDIYCDTSLIIEALEHYFSDGYPTLYPVGKDGKRNRGMIRGFASYWTDRPLFRVMTGLIPGDVWRSSFGRDREGLIGHKIDADKLEAKLPQNLSSYDLQCSLLESQLDLNESNQWLLSTETPSLADVSLFYQLNWGNNIAAGVGLSDLTGGELQDTNNSGANEVFNPERYPALFKWFHNFKKYLNELPLQETEASEQEVIDLLKGCELKAKPQLLPTRNSTIANLDKETGLLIGAQVSIAPDDTGRDDPTLGTLLAMSPEEVVIKPKELETPATVPVHVHFPKIAFVVRPEQKAKL